MLLKKEELKNCGATCVYSFNHDDIVREIRGCNMDALELLYDHYKETFSLSKEVQTRRNKSFIVLYVLEASSGTISGWQSV